MLDYVMFTLLSPANGAACASSLGSTQQAGLLIGEEEMFLFFFLSQELQKYRGKVKQLAPIITIHRLQGKRKQDVSCWWRKKICCYVAQMSEYTSCPAIYLFIYFCRGTLKGSHIRALLKHFVAPHRPTAEITCRPLKVKYQQVLSLIKASRMSRFFFFFYTLAVALRWDLAANQEVSAQRLFKVMLGSTRFEITSVCGWRATYTEKHSVQTLCEGRLKACMWPVSITTLSHTRWV